MKTNVVVVTVVYSLISVCMSAAVALENKSISDFLVMIAMFSTLYLVLYIVTSKH